MLYGRKAETCTDMPILAYIWLILAYNQPILAYNRPIRVVKAADDSADSH